MSQQLYSDHNGIIRLYDGTIVYVVEIQYSADGRTFWESSFNPAPHYYETDNLTWLQGHKYMRVRHAGNTQFEKPAYIVAQDGKSPEVRIAGDWVQWGYADVPDSWQNLIDLNTLKGAEGDSGPEGKGLAVNSTGYYGEFSRSYPTPGCTTCNRTGEQITNPWLVLSLGDGVHKILQADVDAAKFRSDDGITWIALGNNDVGRYTRFIANDGLGSNYADYKKMNTEYNSQGKVYAYSDGMWIEMSGLTSGSYLVAAVDGAQGKFLSDFSSSTIGIDSAENLEVKDDSIGVSKIDDAAIGHGLSMGTQIKVITTDFDGFGLATYISDTSSEQMLQVVANTLVGDGLQAIQRDSVDGEDREVLAVNVEDFVKQDAGLGIEVGPGGFSDIFVKAGDAVVVDGAGVNVVADEQTLNAAGAAVISVMPTDNLTKGIRPLHVNMEVVDPSKGIQKGNGSAADVNGKLEVKVDAKSTGFDGLGRVTILDAGVEGKHLNNNTADETRGIYILQDRLAVKLANSLEFDEEGRIAINYARLFTNNSVTALNDLVGNLYITEDNDFSDSSGITLSVSNYGSNIVLSVLVDKNALLEFIGASGGSFSVAPHTHLMENISGLLDELEKRLEIDKTYGGNFRVDSVHGPIWKVSGEDLWYRVFTDSLGNLGTQIVIPTGGTAGEEEEDPIPGAEPIDLIQSDWNETDITKISYIKNKPNVLSPGLAQDYLFIGNSGNVATPISLAALASALTPFLDIPSGGGELLELDGGSATESGTTDIDGGEAI